MYENKPYGILGDGGFSFNQKKDKTQIVSAKPNKCPRKIKGQPRETLSANEKAKNTTISKYRVVVENTIGQVKRWKILSDCYCHYIASNETQQIPFEDILWVCASLTNQKIKKKPLQSDDWQPGNLMHYLKGDIDNLTWLIQNILNIE